MTFDRHDSFIRQPRQRRSLRVVICLLPLILALTGAEAQTSSSSSFNELAERAGTAREKGELSSAIQLYRRALAQKPQWQEGWWNYGSLLYDDNQFPAASSALHKLTVLNPKLGGAWALLGLSEYETGRYDSALNDLQRARSLGTGSNSDLADVADYHLAVLLNLHGQFEAANLLLSSLLKSGRKSEDLQVAMGMAFLRVPLLPSQIDPSKDALIHDAGSLAAVLNRKEYEEAEAGFQALLEKYPGTNFVHYSWGAMLASQGKDDAAEMQFQEETKLNPASSLAYTEWAYLESKAGRFSEAISLSKKAVELSDNSFMAHYVLGNSLLATGKIEDSVPQLERARDMAPESPEIRYSLSRAYAKLGKNDLARREQAEFLRLKSKQQSLQDEGVKRPSPLNTDSAAPQANPPSQP
jgi:predicted Zn-dependent protease